MVEELHVSEIPDEHLVFIKQVAKLAIENGIDEVTFSYTPNWSTEPMYLRSISGKITANIKTTDDRGRPHHQINIDLDSKLCISI